MYAVVSLHVYGCGGGGVAAAGLVLPEKKALGVKSGLFSILVSYVILGLTADGSCTYASQNKYFGTIRTKKISSACRIFLLACYSKVCVLDGAPADPMPKKSYEIRASLLFKLRFAPAVPPLAPKKKYV